MSVPVLVEGVSDRGLVKGMAKRVGAAADVRMLRGNRPGKVKRMIEAVRAERVTVLKDEHRYPGTPLKENYKNKTLYVAL